MDEFKALPTKSAPAALTAQAVHTGTPLTRDNQKLPATSCSAS